jgi:iron complex outermembrane receptor protein
MTKSFLRALLGASALVAAAPCAAPAFAQGASELTEVVVTARRMDERLQDVPISITVFNQEELTKRNVVSGADLVTFTPSMAVDTQFGINNASFSLRGFRQERRTSASVGTYFADVVAPRGGNGGSPAGDGAGPGSFFDLQNVQVLKGPQGTLFGRNTTGGAVLLVPNKPTDQVEGYIEGSAGNYDLRRLQAVANLPLSENVKLRVGFDTEKRDGYLKNITGIGPKDFYNINYVAFRASLLVDITPDIENYTIFSYLNSEDHGPNHKLMFATSSADCSSGGFVGGLPYGQWSCQQMQREAATGFFSISNKEPRAKNLLEQWQIINATTWNVNENLKVKNIASYSTLKNAIQSELFGTYFVLPSTIQVQRPTGVVTLPTGAAAGSVFGYFQSYHIPGGNTADQENFTEELQVQGKAWGDKLIWQAGAYFEQSLPNAPSGSQSPGSIPCANAPTLACTDVLGVFAGRRVGQIAYSAAEVYFQNLGVYGQATYALTDQLKFTAGYRYTWDSTKQTSQMITYRFSTPTGAPAPAPIITCALPNGDVNCRYYAKQKSEAPTWVLSLEYKPTEDILLYAKYARGYRQGAVSYNSPPPYQAFRPESVNSYEVGAKSSFNWPAPTVINISAFYNDLSDQQLAVAVSSSTNAATPTLAVINAAAARIQGVELEAMVKPFKGFTLEAQYAYLHTKVKKIDPIVVVPGSPYDVFRPSVFAGSRLPFTPTHKWVLTATYDLPLPEEMGGLDVSATYTFNDDYVYTSGVHGIIGSNELISASANWTSMFGKPIDLSIFATNLTNQHYVNGISDNSAGGGHVGVLIAEPRMYGVRLRYRWGG